MIFLGIDGGGTSTRAAIVNFSTEHPQVLARGEAASSNHYSVGLEKACDNIRAAASSALSNLPTHQRQMSAWGLGLAGACTPAEQNLLSQHIAQIAAVPIVVDEDVAAAHAGAFGWKDGSIQAGVVCIAGTGANSFGINDQGVRARADGLGPLLGDRGSGYRIGEAALRVACSADDESGPATTLLAQVLSHLALHNVDELVQCVYAPTFSKDRVAALFPVVLQCADSGDSVAQQILQQASHDLAATCGAVMHKLQSYHVATTGGVLNQSVVRTLFVHNLQTRFPHVQVREPLYDAAVGAALLAKCRA